MLLEDSMESMLDSNISSLPLKQPLKEECEIFLVLDLFLLEIKIIFTDGQKIQPSKPAQLVQLPIPASDIRSTDTLL